EALGDEGLRGAIALYEALERDRKPRDETAVRARRALAVEGEQVGADRPAARGRAARPRRVLQGDEQVGRAVAVDVHDRGRGDHLVVARVGLARRDRKSTRLNS